MLFPVAQTADVMTILLKCLQTHKCKARWDALLTSQSTCPRMLSKGHFYISEFGKCLWCDCIEVSEISVAPDKIQCQIDLVVAGLELLPHMKTVKFTETTCIICSKCPWNTTGTLANVISDSTVRRRLRPRSVRCRWSPVRPDLTSSSDLSSVNWRHR